MRTRREFILAPAAWPALAWIGTGIAQSKPPVLIGWLHSGSRSGSARTLAPFKEGMAALGGRESSNYVLEEHWAEGQVHRLPALVEALKLKQPAVIVTATRVAVEAAAKAAPRTPLVQGNGADLVAAGLVASLARPGGMVTGVTNLIFEVSAKYLELLLAAAPKLKRVGFLVDSSSTYPARFVEMARRAAAQSSVEARFAEVARAEEIEPALSRLAKEGVQGLVISPTSGLFNVERRHIVKFALAQRWPVAAGTQPWVDEGALLYYGPDTTAQYRRAAYYVDRILKGTKPGDLPIEQPTKFELMINMKTAKAIGLTISQDLLFRADKVIE